MQRELLSWLYERRDVVVFRAKIIALSDTLKDPNTFSILLKDLTLIDRGFKDNHLFKQVLTEHCWVNFSKVKAQRLGLKPGYTIAFSAVIHKYGKFHQGIYRENYSLKNMTRISIQRMETL